MGRPTNIKEETLLQAIEGSRGIYSTIASRLKVNWHTAKKYIDMYESTREAVQAESEILVDKAESVLYEALDNGDVNIAKYILSTKGRDRGFSEKIDLNANLNVVYLDAEDEAL